MEHHTTPDDRLMDVLEPLQKQCKTLSMRTASSTGFYVIFQLLALQAARGGYPLEHPVTLGAVLFIVLTFTALPRDYAPTAISQEATGEEILPLLNQLGTLQRWGVILRVAFSIGAITTIVLVPKLL